MSETKNSFLPRDRDLSGLCYNAENKQSNKQGGDKNTKIN